MTLVVTEILPEALQLEWLGRSAARLSASHRAGHSFDDCQGPLVPLRE